MHQSTSEPVLVTGGFGAIGSWVTRILVEEGRPVVVMSRGENYSMLPDLRERITYAQGDFSDTPRLAEIVREHSIRHIIHTAGEMGAACDRDPVLAYRVNVMGGVGLFEVARRAGINRVVFTSGKGVYGALPPEYCAPIWKPLTEDYQGLPMHTYGSTKKALEDAARQYARMYGMEFATFRLGGTYGPGKRLAGYSGLKSQIIEAGLSGEPLVIPTPDVIDDIVFNRDVARAHVLACFGPKTEHFQFNISGGELVSLRDFAQEVMRLCPNHRLSFSDEPEPMDDSKLTARLSIERAGEELGFVPNYPGVKGVAAYIEHRKLLESYAAPA
jgi:UDP-glucose 4-epimerase